MRRPEPSVGHGSPARGLEAESGAGQGRGGARCSPRPPGWNQGEGAGRAAGKRGVQTDSCGRAKPVPAPHGNATRCTPKRHEAPAESCRNFAAVPTAREQKRPERPSANDKETRVHLHRGASPARGKGPPLTLTTARTGPEHPALRESRPRAGRAAWFHRRDVSTDRKWVSGRQGLGGRG